MSSTESLPPADYEPQDASPRAVLFTAGIVAGSVIVCLLACVWFYLARYDPLPPPKPIGRQTAFQDGSHLQTSIARDWSEQDRDVRAHLDAYGWVDRNAGVVRIPIERAIDLIATENARQTLPSEKGGGR
jgi:hypothetical protein